MCPKSSEERPLTLQPLAELDRGTRNAVSKICQATGVTLHELDEQALSRTMRKESGVTSTPLLSARQSAANVASTCGELLSRRCIWKKTHI